MFQAGSASNSLLQDPLEGQGHFAEYQQSHPCNIATVSPSNCFLQPTMMDRNEEHLPTRLLVNQKVNRIHFFRVHLGERITNSIKM